MDDISLKVHPFTIDSKVTDDSQVYEALAYHVSQSNMNKRIQSVGFWSLQVTVASAIGMIRTILDPVATQIRDVYLSERAVG